jgi:hypothetical protein
LNLFLFITSEMQEILTKYQLNCDSKENLIESVSRLSELQFRELVYELIEIIGNRSQRRFCTFSPTLDSSNFSRWLHGKKDFPSLSIRVAEKIHHFITDISPEHKISQISDVVICYLDLLSILQGILDLHTIFIVDDDNMAYVLQRHEKRCLELVHAGAQFITVTSHKLYYKFDWVFKVISHFQSKKYVNIRCSSIAFGLAQHFRHVRFILLSKDKSFQEIAAETREMAVCDWISSDDDFVKLIKSLT